MQEQLRISQADGLPIRRLVEPDGTEYVVGSWRGELVTMYVSIEKPYRVYCHECHEVVAGLEQRGDIFWDVTTFSPHALPPYMPLRGLIDTETALAICKASCPHEKAREAAREARARGLPA